MKTTGHLVMWCALVASALVSCPLRAQESALLDPARITSGEFEAEPFGPVRWLDGFHYVTLEPGAGALQLVRYDAVSGERKTVVPAAWLVPRASALPRPLIIEDYAFAPDGRSVLLFHDSQKVWRQNTRGEYSVQDLSGEHLRRRLGGKLPKGSLMFAKFSPQGDRVAYVSGNDLYVEDLASGTQTRLTQDGSRTIINGTFDWVYEEEFDCRDGFRWSPDGKSIAYWQLDCSGVGDFLMIDNLSSIYSKVVPVQYPKAGTTNSSCRIGVIPAAGGDTVWMKTPGDPRHTYLARMEWHPSGKELVVQWLPRQQNELRVLGCDAATGDAAVVCADKDDAYVDVHDDFRWQAGLPARFVWTSDYRGVRQVCRQSWHVGASVHGDLAPLLNADPEPLTELAGDVISVDFADGALYVSGCDGNPTQKYLFAVGAGKKTVRVTPADQPGWHDYQISKDGSLAIHTWSRFDTPPVIDVVKLPSHERVRVLNDNRELGERYAKVRKGKNEFFRVKIADGTELDGWAMYPAEFDPAKKWPVLFHVYGEPWDQTVKDTWELEHRMFHRWLTQLGYVVMSVDARGTPAPRGRAWRKALYQKIGVLSSKDWSEAVPALCGQHSWMDRSRLAIWGWSGGGSMTLNMLFRYPDLFAAGMSVAPVTDVALYDTIYQERYLGLPQEVPQVYRECSPISFAKNLKGALLLMHGTGDDNVHYQNSERLVDELIRQGKLFEFRAYPNRTHSLAEGEGTQAHVYATLADFLKRRVAPGAR
jgi:dipeptidyl-peptidase-4